MSGPPLFLGVVVRAVGPGQEGEPVGDGLQGRAEGVGRPAHVPAERAGGHALQHDARLPALAEHHVEAVQAPQRQQIGGAASAHPDDVLRQQVGPHVRHVRHREQGQVRADEAELGERVVRRRQPRRVVAHGGGDDAEAGVRAGLGQVGGQPVGRARPQIGRIGSVGLEPDGGGDDGRLASRHVRRGGPRG